MNTVIRCHFLGFHSSSGGSTVIVSLFPLHSLLSLSSVALLALLFVVLQIILRSKYLQESPAVQIRQLLYCLCCCHTIVSLAQFVGRSHVSECQFQQSYCVVAVVQLLGLFDSRAKPDFMQ